MEIYKTKMELLFEFGRLPTEEEVVKRLKISPERYREVLRAAKPVYSLNSKHAVTQEEFIKGITDVDGVGADNRRQLALLRLALDDVVTFQYLHLLAQLVSIADHVFVLSAGFTEA